MFTSRDLLGELARYPNKADALKTRAHEFMIPLSRMIYASAKDSLYQCLLVMSELKVVGVIAVAPLYQEDGTLPRRVLCIIAPLCKRPNRACQGLGIIAPFYEKADRCLRIILASLESGHPALFRLGETFDVGVMTFHRPVQGNWD